MLSPRKALAGVVAMLALGGLGGCHVQEYVVAKNEVPLYSTKACDRVADVMPLGHHERVVDDEVGDGVVKVTYNGQEGYVKKDGVRVLSYMHPQLDDGQDKEATVDRCVRDVAVEHAGQDWDADTRDAVRDGRVVEGMTREQVELAWGWPRTIEPLASPVGGERWIFRKHGYETLDGGAISGRRFRAGRGGDGASWGYSATSSSYRMPVVEERVVEFSDRKVTRSFVRRYYDVDGGESDSDDRS